MSGGSFSLVEKLAVTGAFCALVAMAVGTEDDPGVVAQAKQNLGTQSGSPIQHNGAPPPAPPPPLSQGVLPPPVESIAPPPVLPAATPAPQVMIPLPEPTEAPVPNGASNPQPGQAPVDMRAVNANM